LYKNFYVVTTFLYENFKKLHKKILPSPTSFPTHVWTFIHYAIYLLSLLYFFGNSCRRCSLPLRNVEGSGKSYLRARSIILLGMQIKPFKSSDELPELPAYSKKKGTARQRAKKSEVSSRWKWRRNQHEFE